MLLHEAKKRAEKRHAKRIANRKSASSSRARKKALVQEMTELNARLRRQALILSLLPDLVIVINIEGIITFSSAQVERVLQHNINDLVGAKLMEIVVPGSRDRLSKLIQDILSPRAKKLVAQDDRKSTTGEDKPRKASDLKKKKKSKLQKELDEEAQLTSGESANAVTDTSFPLSVVQVEQTDTTPGSSDENDNSDESNSKQPSSLTTNSIAGNSGSDGGIVNDVGRAAVKKSSAVSSLTSGDAKPNDHVQSSDSSNTSSNTETSDAKNLFTANANLERNVRWHNKKIMKASKRDGFTDDVLGAAVTANNATARLSSLRHRASDSEEDSGYRESNDSREETSSSEGEASSQSNGTSFACNTCLLLLLV
jgi:PAS fold